MIKKHKKNERGILFAALVLIIISFACRTAFSLDVHGSFRVGNAPPSLLSDIPNQSWNMNTQNIGLDLDSYFSDPDGDTINYDYSTTDNPHINISIDSGNIVTFTPENRWNGTEYAVFYASDGIWEATESNNVTLNVLYANTAPSILTYTPSSSSINISEQSGQTFTISFTDGEQDNINVTWKVNGTTVQHTSYNLPNSSYTNSSTYIFTTNYSSAGIYQITVFVSDGTASSTLPAWTLNVTDSNRAPRFISTIANLTWNQGSSYTIDSLLNYVEDPDTGIDDSLSFDYIPVGSPSNITVTIDPITSKVTFKPYTFFYGTEDYYFEVQDSKGAYNFSNNLTLKITELSAASNTNTTGVGGAKYEPCENYYRCGQWSKCKPSINKRTRTCVDLAECYYRLNPPAERESCTYIPSCYDNTQNQGEDLIDCGGPCVPCWTCFDGIKNQGEEKIDCGGPCKACSTCSDGIKNCQIVGEGKILCEENIDCGGPCKSCEMLSPFNFMKFMKIIIINLAILAFSFAIFFFFKRFILPKLREKKEISERDICIKELTKAEKELTSIEKGFYAMHIHDLLERLSVILNIIVSCKFKINGPYTQKELIEKLAFVKGEHFTKEIILKIHSLLYDMKFSGEEVNREYLLRIAEELKVISAAEIEKSSYEGKNKKTLLIRLYNLYLEEFYYSYKENHSKAREIYKSIEKLTKTLSKEELVKIKILSVQKKALIFSEKESNDPKENKDNKINAKHFEHNITTMAIVLVVAGIIGILLLKSPLMHNAEDKISGFVVYDETNISSEDNQTLNETSENLTEDEQINLQNMTEQLVDTEEPPSLDNGVQPSGGRIFGTMGVASPTFIGLTNGQVLTSTEDNYSTWMIQGQDTDEEYPLVFSFLAEEIDSKFILNVLPHTITSFNNTAAWINFTPTETYGWDSNKAAANYTVTIVVKDSSEASATVSVIFNVTNVNDAPNITSYTPSSLTPSVAENSSLTFTYDNTTADPDLIHPGVDSVNQTWYFDGVVNNTNLSWGYSPGFCNSGTHNSTLNVTDRSGNSTKKVWTITVTNTNRAPTNNKSFSGYNYVQWVEDNSVLNNITLSQFFNDTDRAECSGSNRDDLSFGYEFISISSVNNSARINVSIDSTSYNVSFLPSSNWYGVEVIRFFANDSHTLTYSDVNITLNVTNVNDAPILYNISQQNLTSNILFTLTFNATDVDNDTLTFSDNATIFNISSATGIINFTPTAEQIGNYSIMVNVTDASGLYSSIIFNMTVNVGNRPPTIDQIYPYAKPVSETLVLSFTNASLFSGKITSFNTSEDTTVIFNHTSIDLDGDTLNCTWYLNSVLVKNETCSNVSYWDYYINFTQSGMRNVTAFVDDMKNSTSTKDYFTWNFSVANVNREPKFGKKNLTSYSDFSSGTLNQTNITVQLGNITLGKSDGINYYMNGTYLSSAINLQASYDKTNITSINWVVSKPSGTNLFLRVKTANSSANLASANWSSYDNTTQISLSEIKTSYVQFEINMTTTDPAAAPVLESLTINYEIKQYDTITGNINSWIDLDNYFSDVDTDDTLTYGAEIISGSSSISLSVDSGDNTVDLTASASGSASFRFYANDSYSTVYSNNITAIIEIYSVPTTSIGTGGGGGGGGSKSKVRIIEEEKPYYLQLVYVKPLETVENKEMLSPDKQGNLSDGSFTIFRAPILLNNTANETLTGIHLSAKANVPGVSFDFKEPEIKSIEQQSYVMTDLYITQSNKITGAYSVDVIANIDSPETEDVTTININPLSNLSKKVQSVMDMIKLNPICRELEEVVAKAQEAIQKKDYKDAEKLLDDAISGCKYLISASQKDLSNTPKKSFVLVSKWIYISIGLFACLLILSYLIPKIINRNAQDKFQKKRVKNKK